MRIILNGNLTREISLRRGVRHGDPLSPLLYSLCVEVLANQICNSHEVSGFLLPGAHGKQGKVRQYADDTTTVLKNFRSLISLFDLISVYERGSGSYVVGSFERSPRSAPWPYLGA